jgi:microcystin-dependent protein
MQSYLILHNATLLITYFNSNKIGETMDGYIGEVKMFVGTFAPLNWEFCWGQTLQISSYSSLYSIIGAQFGGDGVTTFKLPDLRGRIPIGGGDGPNLTPRTPGQMGGAENVTLTTAQLPSHQHTVKCDTTGTSASNTPANNLPSLTSQGNSYSPGTGTTTTMKADMLSGAGNSQPHDNMPPWGCINYIICVEGMWPPRS